MLMNANGLEPLIVLTATRLAGYIGFVLTKVKHATLSGKAIKTEGVSFPIAVRSEGHPVPSDSACYDASKPVLPAAASRN